MSAASCGCPEDEGLVRHQKGTCTDPVVAELGWYFEPPAGPAPAADPVAACLAGIKERSEQPLSHVGSLPIGHDGVRELMESAADVPSLVAALEAVLALAVAWSAEPIPSASHAGSVQAANVLRLCGASLQGAIGSALRDAQGGAGQ